MDTTCRLCSLTSISLQSVFSVINDRLLIDMISIVCPVKIEANDKLPQGICSLCLKIILDANALRTKSVQSELKFKSIYFNTQNAETSDQSNFNIINIKNQDSEAVNQNFNTQDPIALHQSNMNYDDQDPEILGIKQEGEENSNCSFDYAKEDEQVSFDENSCNESDSELYEPDEKRIKIDKVHSSNKVNPNRSTTDQQLNKRVKQYFHHPVAKGGKWGCKLCGKTYAGNVNNLKDHLTLTHRDIGKMLGLTRKSKLRGSGSFRGRMTNS